MRIKISFMIFIICITFFVTGNDFAQAAEKKAVFVIDLPVNILSSQYFQRQTETKIRTKISPAVQLIPLVATQLEVRVYKDNKGLKEADKLSRYDLKKLNNKWQADWIVYITLDLIGKKGMESVTDNMLGSYTYGMEKYYIADYGYAAEIYNAANNKWQHINKGSGGKKGAKDIKSFMINYGRKYDDRYLNLVLQAIDGLPIIN